MLRVTAHKIDAEAARWAARIDRGLSADEECAFQSWIDGDSRRLGAYGRIRAVALQTLRAKALGSQFDSGIFLPPSAMPASSNRRTLIGGAAVVGFMSAAGAAGIALIDGGRLHTTRKGEMKVAPLADGSVVTLNTASSIIVRFTKHHRDVIFITGEALFDVAKDTSRPFIVRIGPTQVRAVGTSFAIRRLGKDAAVQVLVREGVVEITKAGRMAGRPIRVTANCRAIGLPSRPVITATPVAPAEIHRELAWRDGRIAFEGESLAQAAAEFSRYSDTRILIEDPAMAKEGIAGLFQADDPVGFARAAAATLDGHTVVGEGEVQITR